MKKCKTRNEMFVFLNFNKELKFVGYEL